MGNPNGKFQLQLQAGTTTELGFKPELNLDASLFKKGMAEGFLSIHSELKGSLRHGSFDGSDLTPPDLVVGDIYKDGIDLALFKAVTFKLKLDLADKMTLTLGTLWDDVGRTLTTNGFSRLGLKEVAPLARDPIIFNFERPRVHNFPGSNLGLSAELVANPSDILFWRLFFGVTNGRSSKGLFGFRVPDWEDDSTIQVVSPKGQDPAASDPFAQGAFITAGGGVGVRSDDGQFRLALDGSVSIRTYPDQDTKKRTFDKQTDDADATVMPHVSIGLFLFERLSLFTDLSWVLDSGAHDKDQFSWRLAGEGIVLKGPWGALGLVAGGMQAQVNKGARFDEDVPWVLNENNTTIIGPTGPVTITESTGGSGVIEGGSFAAGAHLVWNLNLQHLLDFTLEGGFLTDSRLDGFTGLFNSRLAYLFKF